MTFHHPTRPRVSRTVITVLPFLWFAATADADAPQALKVVGNQLVTADDNQPIRLRGVNTASLEWTSNGEGHILDTVRVALDDWHVNHIRLPLSQDRWFGKAPEQKDDGAAYRDLVKQIIDTCSEKGIYVIIDLHWNTGGDWGKNIGQHAMPDAHSLTFWKDFATTYKNHPAVLFDLYNEPHDVSWDVWRNGGEVTETLQRGSGKNTFTAVGMQPLLDAVRATGARNVTVIGGLDWSYDLSHLIDNPLNDPNGDGLIYANHTYPFKGDTIEVWLAKMQKASEKLPIIISEFGSETRPRRRPPANAGAEPTTDTPDTPTLNPAGLTDRAWVEAVLKADDDHNWHWTAWDLHPAAGPRLIADWNYTPTPNFGVPVKASLTGGTPESKP